MYLGLLLANFETSYIHHYIPTHMTPLNEVVSAIDHSREKRAQLANLIVSNPKLLPDLLEICALVDEEVSCRAAWGLEYMCKTNINEILPYLDQLLTIMPKVYKHPAVRPMAKIVELLMILYYQKKDAVIQQSVTHLHREKITEIGFDWLITDQKVAVKAYTMTSLYLLGTEFDWIHAELKTLLENNYSTGSAAYKARSRMILKKLNK